MQIFIGNLIMLSRIWVVIIQVMGRKTHQGAHARVSVYWQYINSLGGYKFHSSPSNLGQNRQRIMRTIILLMLSVLSVFSEGKYSFIFFFCFFCFLLKVYVPSHLMKWLPYIPWYWKTEIAYWVFFLTYSIMGENS